MIELQEKDQREYQDYETSEDPEGKTDRNSFFVDRKAHIYPDTLCWTSIMLMHSMILTLKIISIILHLMIIQ